MTKQSKPKLVSDKIFKERLQVMEMLDTTICDDPEVSAGQYRVFARLKKFYKAQDNKCWTTRQTLAELMSVDRETISKALKKLKALGYINFEESGNYRNSRDVTYFYFNASKIKQRAKPEKANQPMEALDLNAFENGHMSLDSDDMSPENDLMSPDSDMKSLENEMMSLDRDDIPSKCHTTDSNYSKELKLENESKNKQIEINRKKIQFEPVDIDSIIETLDKPKKLVSIRDYKARLAG